MNGLLDWWAAINTMIIMFSLGMSYSSNSQSSNCLSWPMARAILAYNLLIPGGVLVGVILLDWFSPTVITGMALCVASAGGSSAGAFVLGVRGAGTAAATLIVALAGVSLLAVACFAHWGMIKLGELSLGALAGYLIALSILPLYAGRLTRSLFSNLCDKLLPILERLGSLLVFLLVVTLVFRYGAEILTGPTEPLIAALALVTTFVVPALFERPLYWMRTVVFVTLIRNLSLALSLLAVLPDSQHILPTVLAFGLLMYLLAGGLLWHWRLKA
jgi:predicted Na+-dependent transporter